MTRRVYILHHLRVPPLPFMSRCVPLFKIDFPPSLAPRLSAFFTPAPLAISHITCPASSSTVGKMISFNKGTPTLLTILNNLNWSPPPD